MNNLRLFTNPTGSEFVEFSAPRPGKTLTAEIATRDIDGAFSTFYQVVQNPDPVLKRTGNYIAILDEIKREPRVSSCSISRESGVLLRKWKLEPNKASTGSVDTIESLFNDLDMRQIMREILEAWGYGYQVSEIVWERVGNMLLPAKIIGKPKEWFVFGRENELRIKRSLGDINGEIVEQRKFLLTQYRASYRNPYGEAQFSLCFWPVTFKKGGLKFWSVFLEKFGMPHAVGKMSRSANPQERNDLLAALASLVRDACAVFPDDATVELLTSNVTGSADAYEQFARFHNSEISTVILGHTGSSESTPGRLGNDTSAMEVRADIIENDCSMVQSTINTLIKWIYEFNPSLGTERPSFELYEETDVDKDRAARDVALMGTGKVKLSKNYFVKNYDFDEEDIEVVDAPAETTVPDKTPAPEFSAAPEQVPLSSQNDIDELVEGLSNPGTLQSQIKDLLKPVFDLIENSKSFDEVKTGLAALYPKLSDKEIQEYLEKAMFLSATWGRLTEGEETV